MLRNDHLLRTPDAALGPFYPVLRCAVPAKFDLTEGLPDLVGQFIELVGTVVNVEGQAVSGACVEIWQADASGRYAHPCDAGVACGARRFVGYGCQRTSESGGFRFRTVKPGAYRTEDLRERAPHVHFQVTGRWERLVTQMFFAEEPLNAAEFALASVTRSSALVAQWQVASEELAGSLHRVATWTIVMTRG